MSLPEGDGVPWTFLVAVALVIGCYVVSVLTGGPPYV